MTNENKDTHGFKAGDVAYELFISQVPEEEDYELYEKENPKEGMTFSSNKQLISFVNFLTDIVEEEVLDGNS